MKIIKTLSLTITLILVYTNTSLAQTPPPPLERPKRVKRMKAKAEERFVNADTNQYSKLSLKGIRPHADKVNCI
jgi:hypothetical protein